MSEVDELLDEIQTGIDQATDKLDDGRIRDIEKENARLAYLGRLNSLAETKFTVLLNKDDME